MNVMLEVYKQGDFQSSCSWAGGKALLRLISATLADHSDPPHITRFVYYTLSLKSTPTVRTS